jgi:hypothetical protein
MNRLIFAISAPMCLAACSQDADIGIDSQPVTCNDVGGAEVSGRVTDPSSGTDFEFGPAVPRVALGPATGGIPYTAILNSNTDTGSGLQLRLNFLCGAAELASYGVKPVQQQTLDCPFEVAGSVLGRIEFLDAKSGTLIVDDNANCLAGRFAIDFGEHGSLGGWFSAPWQ